MNFREQEVNWIIAALRYTSMNMVESAKKIKPLIGKRQTAIEQEQFAHECATLAHKIEAQARAGGIRIYMSGG